MFTDIVLSINVHENIEFLIKQIKNIDEYVSLNYIIIINANKYMYNEISNCQCIMSKDNIILNKYYIEKKRFHGSLTNGIYMNIKHAIDNYNFKYFIILSSRTIFYNHLTYENCNSFTKIDNKKTYEQIDKNTWHWPSFLRTKLAKYISKHKLFFSGSAHEGLTFDYVSCKNIVDFLDTNNEIRTNLFNSNSCVEEFALQTICINFGSDCYYIGNGIKTYTDKSKLLENRFVYKITRN